MHQVKVASRDFYCFDCDGVLWRGEEAIPEARDLLIKLKEANKCVRFITNSSVCTRVQHAHKVKRILNLPFDIDPNEIITAAYVTASFLSKTLTRGSAVLVIGMAGIRGELEAVGFKVTREYQEDSRAGYGAVVVGLDGEFTYHSITEAIKVFQHHPDALMIACNLDATYVGDGGQIFPGTGCLVKAVAYAAGKDPIVMGKPNNHIYAALIDSCPHFDPARAIFIGDRLDSDIAFANVNGMFSVLVETGVHKRTDLKEIIPSLCVANLSELSSIL